MLVTLDFETFYSKDFSLSKITTEEYINSPLFEAIGVSVKIDDHPAQWVAGERDIPQILGEVEWPKAKLLCQNTAFDGAILSWRYGHEPMFYLDTLGMARPIHGAHRSCSLASTAAYYGIGNKGTEVVQAMGKRLKDFAAVELAAYGEYCKNDTELTYQLFRKLAKEGFPRSELLIIDCLLRMYINPGFELDKPLLEEHLSAVKESKKDALRYVIECAKEQLHSEGGSAEAAEVVSKIVEMRLKGASIKDVVMSDNNLAALMELAGVLPPKKLSPRTGKEAWAFAKTDQAFKELLDHENPIVSSLVAARLNVKSSIEESRTERFINVADRTGRLPIMLNYWGAHTGRCSGGEKLNLQNLPRGGTLRRALKAPEGHKVIACDAAQIEARVLAYMADQTDLVAAFAADEDVYSLFAEAIYGYAINKDDNPSERQMGKVGILGLGFYMGPDRFIDAVRVMAKKQITLEEAQHVVKVYRTKNKKIVQYWYAAGRALEAMERGESGTIEGPLPIQFCGKTKRVFLPNGLWLSYPNLRREGEEYFYDMWKGRGFVKTKIYSGKLVENIVQAVARIVVFEQMALIAQLLKPMQIKFPALTIRLAVTVHDEVVGIVPEQLAVKIKNAIARIMGTAPQWAPGLPIACEAKIGDNYAECK